MSDVCEGISQRELRGHHKRRAWAGGGAQGQGGHVIVRDGRVVDPHNLARSVGEASLFGIHVTEPAS